MTTIATDGATIASDGRTTAGNEIVTDVGRKLRYLPDGSVIGEAGTCTAAITALAELEAAMVEGREPKFCKGDYTLLQLRADGKAFVYWGELTPIRVPTPCAIGSGGEFARGAMAHGADALEAVRIAKKLDSKSGGRVQSLKPKVAA